MLRSILLTLLVGALSNGAFAQETPSPKGADLYGQNVSPEVLKRAQALALEIDQAARRAAAEPLSPSVATMINNAKRKADDIADKTLATDRDKVLTFLGVNPQGEHALYYFLSWSMPLEMLRSYAIEALWSGGTLVFRGVPPGRDLKDFLVEDLGSLVWGKGSSASIAMDPRLFETYGVGSVPSIVITKDRRNLTCGTQGADAARSADVDGVMVSFQGCPVADPASFIKLTGTVTSDYALRAFIDNGADFAEPFLAALRKGIVFGEASVQAQVPFKGEWKDVVTPAMRMEFEEQRRQAQMKAEEGAKP